MKKALLFCALVGGVTSQALAQTTVPKNCLIEEFTSSTCPPCKSFNQWFDPLINDSFKVNTEAAGFNVIKYQMNWPNPGNDVSYNQHGYSRRQYYSVTGIPDHYTNGAPGTSQSAAQMKTEINGCKGGTSPIKITGTYMVKHDSIMVNVVVTPLVDVTGNYKVYIVAAEKYYENTGNTTGQLKYYNVERRMFPDGNGNTVNDFTAGVTKTYNFGATYTVGNVAQNTFNFWGSPFASNLVVFVQNTTTKEVIQSQVIPARWVTGVANVNASVNEIKLFPNPTSEKAVVAISVAKAADVTVRVSDMTGRVVYTATQNMAQGTRYMDIPVTNLAQGTYNVTVSTVDGVLTERLSVVR